MENCFDRGVDSIARGVFDRNITLPPGSPNVDRAHLWKTLINEKRLLPVGARGKKQDRV